MQPPPPSLHGRRLPLALALCLLLPSAGYSCEPILPLVMLYTGPNSSLIPYGLGALVVATLIKSLAFAYWTPELGRVKATFAMIVANVATSIAGFGAALFVMVPQPMVVGISFCVFVVCLRAARRVSTSPDCPPVLRLSKTSWGILLFLAWLCGTLLFSLSQYQIDGYHLAEHSNAAFYWLTKFLYVFLAVALSMFFTTVIEESVVAWLMCHGQPDVFFYRAAIRANVMTFLLIWGIAAAAMIPRRLEHSDFLASLWAKLMAVL